MTPTPEQLGTIIFFGLLGLLLLALFLAGRVRRARGVAAIRREASRGEEAVLPDPWWELRQEVERSNRFLTPSIFSRTRELFLAYYKDGKMSPAELTSEYDKEEFLLVLDEHGQPGKPFSALVDTYQRISAAHPLFKKWFREAIFTEGESAGMPVLLAARWLCHLVGFRHGTVEIFIDPPNLPGHTLVQVRGMEKYEAPGAFDIPCAGHISDLDTPEAALEKELGEELNLTLDDLDDFRLVGMYNSYTVGDAENGPSIKINNEHRVLYQARIKASAAARIRFADGEVAGLSVFSISELRALVQAYPERVASGLSGAMGFYDG